MLRTTCSPHERTLLVALVRLDRARLSKKVAIPAFVAATALLTQSALAQDVNISGRVHTVKPSKLVKFVSKSKQQPGQAVFALPAPGGGSDPTIGGATLSFEDVGNAANGASYILDATGWTGLGNPAGSKGYRYKGKDDAVDPNPKGTCRVVLVKEKVIKAVCKDDGFGNVPLTTPFVGADSIVLALPVGSAASRYCAEFGGDEAKNTDKLMKRKNAPAPSGCPEDPTPSATATPTVPTTGTATPAASTEKLVFVTNAEFTGALGGLSGADAKCQAAAFNAGPSLTGTYKAWLSDTSDSPSTRFVQATVPYKLVDGTVIANNWADLIDGTLLAAINVDENGDPGSNGVAVWTATETDGTLISGATTALTCDNWTLTTAQADGGRRDFSSFAWTDAGAPNACTGLDHLYCFEQ